MLLLVGVWGDGRFANRPYVVMVEEWAPAFAGVGKGERSLWLGDFRDGDEIPRLRFAALGMTCGGTGNTLSPTLSARRERGQLRCGSLHDRLRMSGGRLGLSEVGGR